MMISNRIIALVILLGGFCQSHAQDYKYQMDDIEKVYIVANTTIILKAHEEAYLVIPSPENKRVRGLDARTKSPKADNTGFNVSIKKHRRTLNIESLQPRFAEPLIIFLPESIKVSAENRYHTDIRLSGFSNEIEVMANHGDVILENVSGPLILDCGHGHTTITLDELNQISPMSIVNSHGVIDITISSKANANLELSVPRGELYSEFEFEGIETNRKGRIKGRISDNLTHKLNGGGVPIMIYSAWGDVYLRKK